MDDIINGFLNGAIQLHLEDSYEVDFIHEVLGIAECSSTHGPSTAIDYRGVNGEYNTHVIPGLPVADFLRGVL